MRKSRQTDAVLLVTALVFVIIALAGEAPTVVFLVVAGVLVYYAYRNRSSDQRA